MPTPHLQIIIILVTSVVLFIEEMWRYLRGTYPFTTGVIYVVLLVGISFLKGGHFVLVRCVIPSVGLVLGTATYMTVSPCLERPATFEQYPKLSNAYCLGVGEYTRC